MKRIEVIVSPQGESRIETHGYEGVSCRSASKSLERALGIQSAETLKPGFYEHHESKIHQKEIE